MSLDEHITRLGDETRSRYCQWIYLGNADHLYVRQETRRGGDPGGPQIQDMAEQLFDHGIFDYVAAANDTESPVLQGHAEGGEILAGTAEADSSNEIDARAYSRAQQLLQHLTDTCSDS